MKWWLCVSLLLLGRAVAELPPLTDQLICVRDLSYYQNYPAAFQKVEKICEDEGNNLAGRFWHLCLLQLLIYDSGNTTLIDSFYHTCDRLIEICSWREKSNPNDARPHLYIGLTLLNRANLLSWQNKKLSAFITMLRVPAHLQRAISLDPHLYDAWFGLAVIEYFKATADRYCLGLGLIGSKKRAYQMMQEAQENGLLLQPMAEFMLGFMHKEDQNYREAIRWCKRLLLRYPDNRAARRLLRDTYLQMGRYDQVVILARELDAEIAATFPNNYYGRSENWLKMAYAWEGLKAQDSVCFYADRIIAWENHAPFTPWLGNYVREARILKNRHYQR